MLQGLRQFAPLAGKVAYTFFGLRCFNALRKLAKRWGERLCELIHVAAPSF